jgi:hypothetical protein
LPISIPFFVSGKKTSGEEFLDFATALNVSRGGVMLAARRYLEQGDQLVLEIPILMANKAHLPHSAAQMHATVVRCTRFRQCFLLGLKFEEPLGDRQDQ